MKFLLLWAMAAVIGFTACNKDDDKGIATLTDDGWYIMGEATALSKIDARGLMVNGINEVNQTELSGLYEKYIALEANKPFTLTKVAGSNQVIIGEGAIETKITNGDDFSINGAEVQHGTYAEGGKPFTVPKDGLYQVVIYETGNLIAIIPIEWNTNNLGALTQSEFNKEKITFTATDVIAEIGTFKVNTWDGWKYIMDIDGTVKVNCNFGFKGTGFKFDGSENALTPGSDDIAIGLNDRGIYTITLTWTLGAGWSHTFAFTKTKELEAINPSKAIFGLIGNAFNKEDGSLADWDYDLPLEYEPLDGITSTQGIYLANVTLIQNGEFKIRKDKKWDTAFGYNEENIVEYDKDGKEIKVSNFEDNGGNIKVKEAKTYSVYFFYDFESSEWLLSFYETK
ncbi:MAG: hypothetical protein ACRCSB_05095 [Bacteroidales bacterium]